MDPPAGCDRPGARQRRSCRLRSGRQRESLRQTDRRPPQSYASSTPRSACSDVHATSSTPSSTHPSAAHRQRRGPSPRRRRRSERAKCCRPVTSVISIFIGGLEKVDIVIVDYDPEWPIRFEQERRTIVGALADRAIVVDHIGSTSVPGLASKPIIDICLTVADSADEGAYLEDLVEAGYQLRVREPAFHEHRMVRSQAHDVHIHVFTLGSSEIDRYLLFRDWLRGHPDDRALYARTKRDLSAQDWPSMQAYADAKTGVVEAIIQRARGGVPPTR